jgi:hypothetical protein
MTTNWHASVVVLAVVLQVGAGSPALNLIDVPSVVCSGGPGETKVHLSDYPFSKKDKPWVPTFYRTSQKQAVVTFSLSDKNGKFICQQKQVTLLELPEGSRPVNMPTPNPDTTIPDAMIARRLVLANSSEQGHPGVIMGSPGFTVQAESKNDLGVVEESAVSEDPLDGDCHSFFLLDGRSVVELPDTWDEARGAFRDLCKQEGVSDSGCAMAEREIFEGYPEVGADDFAIGADLCAKLHAHIGAAQEIQMDASNKDAMQERLPMLPVTGIDAQMFSAPARRAKGWGSSNAGGYSYSSSRQGRNYPYGARQTGYGYSGAGKYTSGMAVPLAVGGGVVGGGVAGAYVYSRYYTYNTHYRDQYNSCHASGWSSCSSASEASSVLPGDTIRDDLMDAGFFPMDFEAPLMLTVSKIEGVDYAASRICPPAGWNLGDTTAWTPPANQDLFFVFSEAEEEEYQPPTSSISTASIVLIILGALICLSSPLVLTDALGPSVTIFIGACFVGASMCIVGIIVR